MLNNIKLLITITDKNKQKEITKIIKKNNIYFNYIVPGYGSASSSLLDYFGLNEVKKQIFISIIPNNLETELLYQLNKALALEKIGSGISFTIPISSSAKYLKDTYEQTSIFEEDKEMNITKIYQLIITITEEGYSETVMSVAKKNGATGGTLIKGSGLGNKEAVRFLGFSIEPEKDISLIVVEDKLKTTLMTAITQAVGLNTKGKGICFSLPISKAIGLGDATGFEKI